MEGVAIFLSSTHLLIVYVVSMNIVYLSSAYSRFQSENECETEQYVERESAIVGSIYNQIYYSYK